MAVFFNIFSKGFITGISEPKSESHYTMDTFEDFWIMATVSI